MDIKQRLSLAPDRVKRLAERYPVVAVVVFAVGLGVGLLIGVWL